MLSIAVSPLPRTPGSVTKGDQSPSGRQSAQNQPGHIYALRVPHQLDFDTKVYVMRSAQSLEWTEAANHCTAIVTWLLARLRYVRHTGTAGAGTMPSGTRKFTW